MDANDVSKSPVSRGAEPVTKGESGLAVFPGLPPDVAAEKAEELLRAADWASFDAERDLPGLREALTSLERSHGVTEAHRFVTARLREHGALLRHPDGHRREPSSHALSPDGRYLAVGSWTGDDHDRGGTIQIWELETARCVNILDGVHGGQGSPTLQWSADGRVLVGEFDMNLVGGWDPFGERVHPTPVDVGHVSIGDRTSVSLDGTLVVLDHGHRLVFRDAVTGEQLAEAENTHDAPTFVWGAGNRLAVFDAEGGHGVDVFEGTEFACRMPLDPKPAKDGFPDGHAWAWSPDGGEAVCLTVDGRVELLDLYGRMRPVSGLATTAIDVPADTLGLWWGAERILVSGGPDSLRFRQVRSGAVMGDFRFGREVRQWRPLWHENQDLGQRFRPDPTFALDDRHWAVALPEGMVIAPGADQATLDQHLSWAVDRRYAWPYRWGEVPLAADVASCFDRLGEAREPLAPLREQCAEAVEPVAWPPPRTHTLDDLYEAAVDSATAFGGAWRKFAATTLRQVAGQWARAGRFEPAEAVLARIPESIPAERVRAEAEVALLLAAAGHREPAAALHRRAVAAADIVDEDRLPFTAAAIGAGFHLFGDAAAARTWIERAVAAITEGPISWQKRLGVCSALLDGGLDDRARELWTEGEPGTPEFRDGWQAHLVRIGRDDLVREFYFVPHSPFDDVVDAYPVLVATGHVDLLREYLVHDEPPGWRNGEGWSEFELDLIAEAERNAAVDRPTEADLAELREEHAALLRLPLGGRGEETKRLVLRAAACGHYSAVLDLLALLPDDDLSDRASTAKRALWIALTGVEEGPW